MSTYAPLVLGTPLTWQASAGTSAMTLDSLTTGTTRQGAKSGTLVDGTKGLPALLEVVVETALQVAATAGTTLDVYLGFSSSATAGTDNAGGLTGTDAALTNADQAAQLVFAGSLVLSNGLGTGTQRQRFLVAPQDAYVCPVVINNSGQTTSASANVTRLTVTPLYQASS